MSNNTEIAGKFRQIAALLEAHPEGDSNVTFKIAAYRRAAQVIEELPRDVSEYGGVTELKKLPSIGDATAHKIVEYLEEGQIKALEKLKLEHGGVSDELMSIENMGPKRAIQFQSELGIKTVPELIEAAKAGKLRDLPRMSEDMEKKILESALRVKERTKRFARSEVRDDVEMLLKTIKDVPGVARAEVAGSYRRKKATVGDIDVLVVTTNPEKISDAIAALPIVRDVVAHGDKKLSFDLHNGLRVDVRFVRKEQWGSALLYFTGSKEHNIAMRKVAISKGWKLNEYGLFEGENVIAQREEEEIYAALMLQYRSPHQRDQGL